MGLCITLQKCVVSWVWPRRAVITFPTHKVDDLCHSSEIGREQLIDHINVNDRLIDNQPQSSSAICAVFEVFLIQTIVSQNLYEVFRVSRTTLFCVMA